MKYKITFNLYDNDLYSHSNNNVEFIEANSVDEAEELFKEKHNTIDTTAYINKIEYEVNDKWTKIEKPSKVVVYKMICKRCGSLIESLYPKTVCFCCASEVNFENDKEEE